MKLLNVVQASTDDTNLTHKKKPTWDQKPSTVNPENLTMTKGGAQAGHLRRSLPNSAPRSAILFRHVSLSTRVATGGQRERLKAVTFLNQSGSSLGVQMPDHEADLRREISDSVALCRRRFSRHGKCARRCYREDLGWYVWDHPLLGSVDRLWNSGRGTSHLRESEGQVLPCRIT